MKYTDELLPLTEDGRCPDCEEEEEEAFTCPTCGRGPWAFYEIEDDQCPLCSGEMDEDDFYD